MTLEQAQKLKSLSNAKKLSEITKDKIDKQIADKELAQFELARSDKGDK